MKTNEQAKQDLVKELEDLSGKIDRLEEFLKMIRPVDEQWLLVGQLKAMTDYKFYLIQRIESLGGLN